MTVFLRLSFPSFTCDRCSALQMQPPSLFYYLSVFLFSLSLCPLPSSLYDKRLLLLKS